MHNYGILECVNQLITSFVISQCVQFVNADVLVELVPRLTDLIKSGIGIGTKVSTRINIPSECL